MKADMFGMFIETLCVEICDAHLECTYWNSRGGGGGHSYCRPTFYLRKIPYFQKLP